MGIEVSVNNLHEFGPQEQDCSDPIRDEDGNAILDESGNPLCEESVTNIFCDTFTDTDGVEILEHIPDRGGVWEHSITITTLVDAVIIDNSLQADWSGMSGGGATEWVVSPTAGELPADVSITMNVLVKTGVPLYSSGSNITFRGIDSTGLNRWAFGVDHTGMHVYAYINGVSTFRQTVASPLDVSMELRVDLVGDSIKCYLDDVLAFDITNTTFQSGTIHGMRMWINDETTGELYDYRIDPLDGV